MRTRERRVAEAISAYLARVGPEPDAGAIARVVGEAASATGCALIIGGRRFQWGDGDGPWLECEIGYGGTVVGTLAVTPESVGSLTGLAAPPPSEPPAPEPTRLRWLMPVTAAVVVVVAALVAGLFLFGGDDGHAVDTAADTKDTTTGAPGSGSTETKVGSPAPKPLVMFDDKLVSPYRAFIASAENWEGTELVDESISHAALTASTADGLRVTWKNAAPGQIYLQTVNSFQDLSSYVDGKGALVFDVLVHKGATGATSVAAHCRYPCGAELNATKLFKALPVGTKTTVTIPLTCFTAMGLNKNTVNTPFLIYAQGPLDVTFRDIRWEVGAADNPDATPCSALS